MTDPAFQTLIVKSLDDLRADVHYVRDRTDQRFDEVGASITELRRHVTSMDAARQTSRSWAKNIALGIVAPLVVAALTALGAMAWAGVFGR